MPSIFKLCLFLCNFLISLLASVTALFLCCVLIKLYKVFKNII